MKKILFQYLLFLLFSFSFQKDESQNNVIYTDYMNCVSHEDLNTCSSVGMKSGLLQCCRIKMNTEEEKLDNCFLWANAYISKEQLNSLQEYIHEIFAYLDVEEKDSFTIEYTCARQSLALVYGPRKFTEDELAIIKDENYCFNIYYQGLVKMAIASTLNTHETTNIKKEDCMNAKLLPNTKNICSYATFDFNLIDGTKGSIPTCLMINTATLETKNIDYSLENTFNSFQTIDGKTVTSFSIDIENKDGTTFKYDSSSKLLTQTSGESDNEGGNGTGNKKGSQNSCKYLKITSFLIYSFLIILF